MKQILILLPLLIATATVQAQGAADSTFRATAVDPTRIPAESYMNLQLPPLHVLLENAHDRSPQVNLFEANRKYEERELKSIRRNWLKYIKLNSTFSYGSTDSNSSLYYDNKYPVVQNVSGVTQRWWNIGASISLPFDELFNRRNRNKQQKERIESICYEQDKWYDDVCLKIIESYTTALENIAILRSMGESMITAKAQYAATEADFLNGALDAQTLSRQKNIESTAIREYEQTRSQLIKSLLQLEVLSKTPIINKMPIGQ